MCEGRKCTGALEVCGVVVRWRLKAVPFGPTGLHFRKSHCASWMLLISFLLDMAIRGMTRHFHICSKLGESRSQTPNP